MLKKTKNKSIGRVLLAVAAIALLMASNMVTFASATETGNVGVNQAITADSMEAMSENTVNYTEMALEFVRESYPDRKLKVVTNDTWMPYPETGYSYAHIKINIIPGANRPEDTVVVSIRHDTLHTEFGYDQYWNDYREFLAFLPAHYRKMSGDLRAIIVARAGSLSEPAMSGELFEVAFLMSQDDLPLFTGKMNNMAISFERKNSASRPGLVSVGTTLSLSDLIEIASLPCVRQVVPNHHIHMKPNLYYSGSYIGAYEAHNEAYGSSWTGYGTSVGILDTGVGDLLVPFGDGIHPGIEYRAGENRGLIDREDFTYDRIIPQDTNGHGTHVAGIIGGDGSWEDWVGRHNKGIAPNVSLVSAKIHTDALLAPSDYDTLFTQIRDGTEWLLSSNTPHTIPNAPQRGPVNIIQMSVGMDPMYSQLPEPKPTYDGNTVFSKYADYVVYNWPYTPYVVAAGNSGETNGIVVIPADAYNVITVGAIENVAAFNPQVAVYSSYEYTEDGRQSIDILAPGTGIYSTAHKWKGPPQGDDDEMEYPGAPYSPGFDYIKASGTSMAAPHVSGVAALLNQNLHIFPNEALLTKAILLNSAEKLDGWSATPTKPLDKKQGAGLVDAMGAISTVVDHRFDSRNYNNLDSYYYHFKVEDVPAYFTTTMTWNRHVAETVNDEGEIDYEAKPLSDFDLILYRMTNGASQEIKIVDSISNKDNVEHIHHQITQPGIYAIEVRPISLTDGPEPVAIAFSHSLYGKGNNLYIDIEMPSSEVKKEGAYWWNTQPININAEATAGDFSIKDVTLRYRYSADNATWGSWANYVTDTAAPWEWSFTWPSGRGYYEFHAIATDNAGNVEGAKTVAEAAYFYIYLPSGKIYINGDAPQTQSRDATIDLSDIATFGPSRMRFANDLNYDWHTKYWTIQSQHPVKPGDTRSIELSGTLDTTRMRVHFERIDIMENVDYIHIRDSSGNVLVSFTGSHTNVEWTSSDADGDINWIEIYMYIGSHPNGNDYYGFKIDRYGYYTQRWSNWETFSASREWTLSPGYGEKTVYCQITDVGENLYETSDNIQYVEHETSFNINSEAEYTNSKIVGLGNLQSQGTPVETRFSNSPSTSWLYKSNPGFQNPREYWWHLTPISPAIDPFPSGCGYGASSTIELKGGSGPVQPPSEATHWRIYFSHVHLMDGDTLRIRYYDPYADTWRLFHEYTGTLDASPMDSVEIPNMYTYKDVRLYFTSNNNNLKSPFAIAAWEWRNNNEYYSPGYDQTWTIPGDPYAPKVGIRFEKIDLGAGDRLTVYHESGNLLGIFDGPVTLTNRFVEGENNDNIKVRLASINPDTRGWGVRINGRYVFDRAWSGWISWPSAPGDWDLAAFGGTTADGTKHVYMQTRYSDNGLGICDDDIILDTTPPAIGSPKVGDPITMLETNQHLCVVGGTTIYYSDKLTSSSQAFTVRGTASNSGGSPLWKATASSAFGYTPPDITATTDDDWEWSFSYDIGHLVSGGGVITISIYDKAGNFNQAVFGYHEDNEEPLIALAFPENDTIVSYSTPTLTWYHASTITGVASYTVQISNDNFDTIFHEGTASTSHYQCPHLVDGDYYWRVLCMDNVGNAGISSVYIITIDTTLPYAIIDSPSHEEVVDGIIEITGIASDDNFLSYRLEYARGYPAIYGFSSIALSMEPALLSGLLGIWNTDAVPVINDVYTLRLTVEDAAGLRQSFSIKLTVSNPDRMELYLSVGLGSIHGYFYLNTPQMLSLRVEDNTDQTIIRNMFHNRWMPAGQHPSSLIWNWTDSFGNLVDVGNYRLVVNSDSDKAPSLSRDVILCGAPEIWVSSGDGTIEPSFSWSNPLSGVPSSWHIYRNSHFLRKTTSLSSTVLCAGRHQTIEIIGEYQDPATGTIYTTISGSIEYSPLMARIYGTISAPAGFWMPSPRGSYSVQFAATINTSSTGYYNVWIGGATVGYPSLPVTDTVVEYEIYIPSGYNTRLLATVNGPARWPDYWRTDYYISSTYYAFLNLLANQDYEFNLEVKHLPYWSPGGACPYVAAWNGEEYEIYNNILGKSDYISDAGPDITDHFRLTASPELLNDVYPVAVGELGNQYSIFDSFELLLVDHNPGSNVIVDTGGNVRTFGVLLPPVSCADKWGVNHLSTVSGDDRVFEGFSGDWLEMDFGIVESNIAKLVLCTDAKPDGGGGGDSPAVEDEIPGPIVVQILDEWGQWINVSEVYPRHYWYNDMIDLSYYLIPGYQLKVRLDWVSYHKLAYLGLDITEDEEIDIHTAPLIRAMDIGQNNITDLLRKPDGRYADMSPGQYMTLDFGYVEQTKPERDFILVSKGYYSVDKEKPMASVVPFPPEAYTHERIYFDARESGYSEESITGYFYYFGDGTTSGWLTTPITSHAYSDDGTYVVTLIVKDDRSPYRIGITTTTVTILNRAPVADIGTYQDIAIELSIAGRKGNAVGVRVYEDGILIHSADVTRTPGQPDTVTLEFNRYLGRLYEIELVYDAAHRGANPTWLTFTSGDTALTFSWTFNTNAGFHQVIPVPSSYLDDVVASNPTFSFDASGSYDIDGEIVSYEWDFGDGTVAQGIMVDHTYSAPGTYEVTLTVTDDDGAVAKESLVIVIR